MLILCDMESRSIPVNGYYYYIKYEWIYFTRNKNISTSIYSIRHIDKYWIVRRMVKYGLHCENIKVNRKDTCVNDLVLVFAIILKDLVFL